ncbi:MAG: hypothetical protein IT581_02105 [Verrucomicrobiales bacterium]|nr:hypothetical protein [Verrucomicrobiales bacterium]
MKRDVLVLLMIISAAARCLGAAASHKENPIGEKTGTVKFNRYWLPKHFNQSVDLSNLSITVWDGTTSGKQLALGTAKAKRRLVHKDSTPTHVIEPPWVAANGAILYAAYTYELDVPLKVSAVFNNNTDHTVDPRAWSWMVLKEPLRFVTVCYTSRGMIATPDMPQENMRPNKLKS